MDLEANRHRSQRLRAKNGWATGLFHDCFCIKILKLFHLLDTRQRITVGLNLPSAALGAKDLIKVENTQLTADQANQLALFAPQATVNIITDFKVVTKHQLQLPEVVVGVFACPNSNCISHREPVRSRFSVRSAQGEVRLKCHFCEKSFTQEIVSDAF
jgi:aspartate carbamoyltransferase regulatory subunit